jgi:hypothetical protein
MKRITKLYEQNADVFNVKRGGSYKTTAFQMVILLTSLISLLVTYIRLMGAKTYTITK